MTKKAALNEQELEKVTGGKDGWGNGAIKIVLGIIKSISQGMKASHKKK